MKTTGEWSASFAAIFGVIVSIVALKIGLDQFTETQKLARANLELQAETLRGQKLAWKLEQEAKAIEQYLRFNELKEELERRDKSKDKKALFWRHNRLLSITETVHRLTLDDPGWDKTVRFMLHEQLPFLRSTQFHCDSFAQSFQALMKEAYPALTCLESAKR